MIFNDGYYHPLDREYGQVWTPESKGIIEPIEGEIEVESKNKLTTQDIGTSVGMMQPGAETLKARIFHGASRVELAFLGSGKGSKEGLTPESYGKEERQAMRDLSRINKVKVSTHATIGINGVSGFSNQESGFNENARKAALTEIKRAIDFAADASTGGAVVVHTGEFPRSIAGYYGEEGVKETKTKFTGYGDEEKKAIHYLVDDHTGKIITGVAEDQVAWIPKQRLDPKTKEPVWMEGPVKGDKLGEMQFEMVTTYLEEIKKKLGDSHPELVKRAEERFKDLKRIPVYEMDTDGNILTELVTFKKFKEDFKRSDGTINTQKATEEFFKKQMETQLHQALGSAREFEQQYIDGIKRRDNLKESYDLYQKYKKEGATTEELKTFIMENFRGPYKQITKDDIGDPDQFVKNRFSENERRIAYGRETSSHGRVQARQIQDRILHAQNIEDYGIKKSADTLAEAAMFAMERTKQANKELEKEGHQKIDPIYVSPENIFQESFGSHPKELKKIIIKSRDAMKERLIQKGYKEKEAKDLSEKHISGTFDIGHANIWKKYYKNDPKKSPEENEKDFNKWLIDEAKDLIKGGFVKHIHVTDNLGFHDEHLAVGQGTAPIKEFVKELEKAGLKDVIIEPGSTNIQTIWPDSVRAMGSPIYATQGFYAQRTFDQIHHAYAGQVNPPYFMVRPDVPSEDEWRLWSQVPLE